MKYLSVGTEGYGGIRGRTMIMATVGGTVSEITGGKFANGAVSGAFVHLFNAEAKINDKAFQEKMKKMFGYTQDPNAAALQASLGKNAENWYNKDAPVAKALIHILAGAHAFGKTIAIIANSLGYGLKTVYYAYFAGSLTGAGLSAESYFGFDTYKPKKIPKEIYDDTND